MSLIATLNSWNGWTDDDQRKDFMKTFFSTDGEPFTSPIGEGKPSVKEIMGMTVPELRKTCKDLGVPRFSTCKNKDDLQNLLKEFDPSKAKKKKSGKDNTKKFNPETDFIKSEFIEEFYSNPEDIKLLQMRRACKAFGLKDPNDPEKNYSSFGKKKPEMIELLSVAIEDVDMDEVRKQESQRQQPTSEDSSSSSSDDGNTTEIEKDAPSDSDDDKPLVESKKSKKSKSKKKKPDEPAEEYDTDIVEPSATLRPLAKPQPKRRTKVQNKDPPPAKNETRDLPNGPTEDVPIGDSSDSGEE